MHPHISLCYLWQTTLGQALFVPRMCHGYQPDRLLSMVQWLKFTRYSSGDRKQYTVDYIIDYYYRLFNSPNQISVETVKRRLAIVLTPTLGDALILADPLILRNLK